jgi:hypothetical protein
VRDWILEKSLEKKMKPKIDTYSCVKCSTALFVGEVGCYHCKYEHDMCIVTGKSFTDIDKSIGKAVVGDVRTCSSCQKSANASDWNQYISQFKACPWCRSPQNISFK